MSSKTCAPRFTVVAIASALIGLGTAGSSEAQVLPTGFYVFTDGSGKAYAGGQAVGMEASSGTTLTGLFEADGNINSPLNNYNFRVGFSNSPAYNEYISNRGGGWTTDVRLVNGYFKAWTQKEASSCRYQGQCILNFRTLSQAGTFGYLSSAYNSIEAAINSGNSRYGTPVSGGLVQAFSRPIQIAWNVGTGTGFNNTTFLAYGLVLPQFEGGSLTVAENGAVIDKNFTVDASPGNGIDANGKNATFSGSFTNAPGAVGSLSFLSTGSPSGTITLTGASSYTGNTNIESGTVVLNGTSTSTTTIFKAATLAGNGSINAPVTNGGSLAPGGNGSKGTFTINGNYVQAASGSLDLEIGGNGEGDLLQINNGQVTDLAGTVKI